MIMNSLYGGSAIMINDKTWKNPVGIPIIAFTKVYQSRVLERGKLGNC